MPTAITFPSSPAAGQQFTDPDGVVWVWKEIAPSGKWGHPPVEAVGATNLAATVSATNIIVTSDTGTDATLPAADGTNAGLMVPAQFTKLAAISGTNTGDQTSIVGITGTKAQFQSAMTDDDFLTLTGNQSISSGIKTLAVGASLAANSGASLVLYTGSIVSILDGVNWTFFGSTGQADLRNAIELGNGNAVTFGTVSATSFSGSGAGLTGLNGFQITTGTVPAAALTNAAPARRLLTGVGPHTAAVGERLTLYNTSTVARINDPTGTSAGQSYTLIVQLGTTNFNGSGTVFAASRFEIVRSYNGASWITVPAVVSGDVTATSIGATTPGTGAFTTVTNSGAAINSAAGAASTPAQHLTGAILTGGTGTTNLPHFLLQPTGTTATTNWNTGGTFFGINAPTGYTGAFFDFKLAGSSTSRASLSVAGGFSCASFVGGSYLRLTGGDSRVYSLTSGIITLYNTAENGFSRLQFGGTSSSFAALQTSGTAITAGLADGTAGGSFVASGTLAVTGASTLTGGYLLGELTVATLPTASTNTRRRYEVTDSLTPSLGATVASGGSARCTVRSNGTNWIVIQLL